MDHERRKFIKLIVVGGVTVFFGKLLVNIAEYLSGGHTNVINFKNFKLVESGKELGIYGSDGEEILIFDKESH